MTKVVDHNVYDSSSFRMASTAMRIVDVEGLLPPTRVRQSVGVPTNPDLFTLPWKEVESRWKEYIVDGKVDMTVRSARIFRYTTKEDKEGTAIELEVEESNTRVKIYQGRGTARLKQIADLINAEAEINGYCLISVNPLKRRDFEAGISYKHEITGAGGFNICLSDAGKELYDRKTAEAETARLATLQRTDSTS